MDPHVTRSKVNRPSGPLVHDNYDPLASIHDQLVAAIQETDGITKKQAELQIKAFKEQVRAFDEMH